MIPALLHYDLPMPALSQSGNHFIVCGDGPLAYRIAYELTSRYGEEVVVVLPDRSKKHGPAVSALPGVTVLESAELTSETFTEAGVASARALALVGSDDMENLQSVCGYHHNQKTAVEARAARQR